MIVTIHEAKTHLSRLLQKVSAGEEVIIAKGKTPVAILQPIPSHLQRIPGLNFGKIFVSDDFDEPLEDFKDYQT